MKCIIVGYGIQGKKRIKTIKKNQLSAIVDPIIKSAKYCFIEQVPLESYDTVILCTPDNKKEEIINYCVKYNKNILVEKPLIFESLKKLIKLEKILYKKKLILYTAYNHRFEPHFEEMKSILDSNELGKIFRLRMFYGNGTSGLVKKSSWRDKGSGVILDIGSHLIDTLIFWFDTYNIVINDVNSFCFENLSPDHAIIKGKIENIFFELEVSLLSWRNDFNCDIIGNKGSAHISSLCKWGPSKIIKRNRVLPAGRPDEKIITLSQSDPTWKKEYLHFKNLITKCKVTNLEVDKRIYDILRKCTL